MAVSTTSSPPTQRMIRTRFRITNVPNDRSEWHGFRMGSMGLGVEFENAMDLGDGLRILRRTVTARNNFFTPGTIEVAAPIGNNTVATIWSIAATAVADNGVIGNSFRNRDLIDCDNETVVRRQRVYAVGSTLQVQRRRVSRGVFERGLA